MGPRITPVFRPWTQGLRFTHFKERVGLPFPVSSHEELMSQLCHSVHAVQLPPFSIVPAHRYFYPLSILARNQLIRDTETGIWYYQIQPEEFTEAVARNLVFFELWALFLRTRTIIEDLALFQRSIAFKIKKYQEKLRLPAVLVAMDIGCVPSVPLPLSYYTDIDISQIPRQKRHPQGLRAICARSLSALSCPGESLNVYI